MAYSKETRNKFIDALAHTGLVSEACELIGIEKKTAYNWRNGDKDFAASWAEAIDRSTSLLEDEATRRAMEKSDNLLMFLLKSRNPKYRDRSTQDLNVKSNVDIVERLQRGRDRVRDNESVN